MTETAAPVLEPTEPTQAQETHSPSPGVQPTAAPPQPANDAAGGGNAAPPPKDPAREAFARLARGEPPEKVNRELYRDAKRPPAGKPAAAPSAAEGQGDRETAGQGDGGTETRNSKLETSSITPEDLQVLKRAQFDLGVWQHIPPSNRKAIVNQFKASQAQADRDYQQRTRAGTDASQPGHRSAATTQAIPETQEAATPQPANDTGQPAGEQQRPPTQPTAAKGSTGAEASPGTLTHPLTGQQLDTQSFVDPRDLETLRSLGGDDLANTYSRGIQRAVGAVMQQVAPTQAALHFVLQQMEAREWSDALSDLKKQSGFEKLGQAEEKALRDKADLLIRAAGDLNSYRYREAVQDAAASLFRTNAQAAAQKALLDRRRDSLRGSPERGTTLPAAQRALTDKERNKAIFEQLSNGLSPDEARRAVDGR